MVLLCNVCVPQGINWTYKQKGVVAIAKWYPAGGFIAGENGAYYGIDAEHIEKFLDEHQHKEIASEHYNMGAGQPNPVRLEYESEDLPKLS